MIDPSITGTVVDPEPVAESASAWSITDLIATVGAALVTAGAAMVYLPAAFVVLGALLLAYAIAASTRETPS